MSTVEVLVSVPFGDAFIERLRAVDPRLRVRECPPELRRWLRGDPMDHGIRATAEGQVDEYLAPTEVLIGWGWLTREAMNRATNLRWIQTAGAGIDRIDKDAHRHLTLTNASGVAAVPIAEYVIGVIIMFAKCIPVLMRRQFARTWDRRIEGVEIEGKTCGIVGMGAIGAETARRARALGMRVIATRRSVTERTADEFAHELLPASDLPYLLAESDYLVITAPLTPETRGLIGGKELRMMKRGAVLINIGRGAVIDESALITALRDGVIAGAGLDVFEKEPLPADSPLWEMENVVITPHSSSGSERYAQRTAEIISDNLRRYLDGKPLRNIVDLDLGY